MKTVLLAAFLLLAGCGLATQALDRTGTTLAQRCADYRGFLATALAVQAVAPTPGRRARVVFYRTFIDVNCPVPR